MDAEQLQKLLNDQILKGLENRYKVFYLYNLGQTVIYFFPPLILGDLKSGGFSIDACRSMVALMDVSSPQIVASLSLKCYLQPFLIVLP